MNPVDKFKLKINQFLAKSGMARSAFGRAAVGDPQFFFRLEKGRHPTLKTVESVEDYIRNWKPEKKNRRHAS